MILKLIILFTVAFIQNMSFILVSRSRNSGDPSRHMRAAIGSNGIWFITQLFMFDLLWMPLIKDGDWASVLIGGLVYVIATSLGSTFMMKLNLGHLKLPYLSKWFGEGGKSQVGKR